MGCVRTCRAVQVCKTVKLVEAFVVGDSSVLYSQLQARNLQNFVFNRENQGVYSVVIDKIQVHFGRNYRAINQVFEDIEEVEDVSFGLFKLIWLSLELLDELVHTLLDEPTFWVRTEGAIHC